MSTRRSRGMKSIAILWWSGSVWMRTIVSERPCVPRRLLLPTSAPSTTMAGPLVIAVDLGGTKLLAGHVDTDGVVVKRTVRPTAVASQEELLAELEGAIEELLEDRVAAIGLGIPSTIDQPHGLAVTSV